VLWRHWNCNILSSTKPEGEILTVVVYSGLRKNTISWDMKFPWSWIRILPYSGMLRRVIWYIGEACYLNNQLSSTPKSESASSSDNASTYVQHYNVTFQKASIFNTIPCSRDYERVSCVWPSGIWSAAPIFTVKDALKTETAGSS
jgi:hypothetical protein